ncbi:PREDICTED: SPX domain-containing protein 4 [Ipomoea nil]|uniref:SPX domain-containing protein 4 n=1 Tax=Ipomoea nil TaxID=35883 RepID=UPI00090173B5|nr:PREDICTED: SPX domain-containing protein 4 [Ipomoea nil]
MKFGKEFKVHLEDTLPEWRDKYLRYKPLKKLLKSLPAHPSAAAAGDGSFQPPPPSELHDWFIRLLTEDLEKFNDFYVEQEEEFIIRFQELKERIERVKEKSGRDVASTSESEEMMDIRKDFVAIHGQMVLLQNYSSLNFAGLVKILKKYDKRTGGLLRLPFTQFAVHQPFFTTEPLTRLVRECEANLELLFPLEAEVIESTAAAHDHAEASSSNVSNISPDTTLQLGEKNVDIYRGTLAAIKAIQGLRKASSTSNPLSFSSLLGNQDNDITGSITAENSSASQDDEEMNQEAEVSHSPK